MFPLRRFYTGNVAAVPRWTLQGKAVTARKRRWKLKRRYAAIKRQPNEGKVERVGVLLGTNAFTSPETSEAELRLSDALASVTGTRPT